MGEVPVYFSFGVLRPKPYNQAQPAADGMAPTHVQDVVIDLAASTLRKLHELKTVEHANLIVPCQQMAIPALDGHLIAIDQAGVTFRALRGIVEMSVAESAGHGDRGARIDGLDRIQDGRIGESGNVSDRSKLTRAEALRARQAASLFSGAEAPGRQTESGDATKGADLKGTVG